MSNDHGLLMFGKTRCDILIYLFQLPGTSGLALWVLQLLPAVAKAAVARSLRKSNENP